MWPDYEILRKVKWLIVLRVIFVSVLLGSLIFAQKAEIAGPGHLYPLYIIIIFTYLLTILYAILLKWTTNIPVFAGVQIAFDVILETAIIYVTGGASSVFQFLYIISIITASLMLVKVIVFLIASMSSLFYAAVLYGLVYKVVPVIGLTTYAEQPKDIFTLSHVVLIHVAAFYLAALLSAHLTASLKKKDVELQKVKINMRELQSLTDTILDTMGSGLLVINRRNQIEIFNKYALEVIEVMGEQEKIARMQVDDIFPSIDFGDVVSSLEKRQRPCFETKVTTASGKKDLTVAFVGLFDQNNTLYGTICTFQDITHIKEIERLMASKEKFAVVGEIASSLVHEMKNPLGAIRSSVQMLQEEVGKAHEESSLVNLVIREVDSLSTLLQEFLYYARLPGKKKECFNLKNLVTDIVRLLKNSKYYRKDMVIKTKFHGRHTIIKCNQVYLRTILWNLSLNALQAIKNQGEVQIATEIHHNHSANMPGNSPSNTPCILVVKVSDTGIGMSTEVQEKIFQPFFSTKTEGSGLGLSVIWRILEEERGKISVESIPHKGTTFTVSLPVTVP